MCAAWTGSAPAMERSRYKRRYDPAGERLVYVGEAAGADFWDRHWLGSADVRYSAEPPRRSLVVRETRRFLPAGRLVLEGGCGLAVNSWNLHRLGYHTLALDYAQRTLHHIARRVPEVRPLAGDVHRLPLSTASIDGYWSLGVVEHFYDGYSSIRDEMARVVRPGGYLFLTFPAMSWLRRAKARLGLYPRWRPERGETDRFYQFALAARLVTADFESHGFRLVRATGDLGVTGLCEELGGLGRLLNRALSGRGRAARLTRAAVNAVVRPFAYHLRLLVLQRIS